MAATACGNTSPVDLCRLFSTPMPSGFVSVSGSPGVPASLRMRRCGSATPVTAMPYLGSGSSTLCPPATWQPASRATSRPPRSTSAASSIGSTSRGQPNRFTATSGVPPIAYTSDSALAAAIRPQSYGSSTTGVKKSVVDTSVLPPGIRTTAASSPASRPTSSSPAGSTGPRPVSAATAASSSPGGILQAQPPPCAYEVSLSTGLSCPAEAYGRLVAPAVFNTVVVRPAGQGGSIPLRLRDTAPPRPGNPGRGGGGRHGNSGSRAIRLPVSPLIVFASPPTHRPLAVPAGPGLGSIAAQPAPRPVLAPSFQPETDMPLLNVALRTPRP